VSPPYPGIQILLNCAKWTRLNTLNRSAGWSSRSQARLQRSLVTLELICRSLSATCD